jgi:hypothetical protein
MPLWCDVSLYDVAARNVMNGGVHYRDVFDTNMPGVVWAHILVRSLAGWSTEAMRLFDAGVLTAITWILAGVLRKAEVPRAGQIWFAVAVVLYYLFQAEICHCQRDLWMLLPVLLAIRQRLQRLSSATTAPPLSLRGRLCHTALEGCLWGLAIWIKPHVLIPTFAVWLASAAWIAGSQSGSWARLIVDTLGLILGGALVGALGIGWMLASGTWGPFWDVFVNWNPHYWAGVCAERPYRYALTFFYFPAWSLLHLFALQLAVWNLIQTRFWLPRPIAASNRTRAMLAALYLGWMAQALYMQQAYDYVHVPEMILALALVSAQECSIGFFYLAWFAGSAVCLFLISLSAPAGKALTRLQEQYPYVAANLLPLHPLARAERTELWPRCWHEGSTPDLRDRLAFLPGKHPSTTWTELEEVADYLRRQGVTDGEVVCWHDATHPLYLMLGIKPAIRFMHVGTSLSMKERQADVLQNLHNARNKKFVVSDLLRVIQSPEAAAQPGPTGFLDLPPILNDSQRQQFPFDQPIVFRSGGGRYLVHRIEKPIERIDIPAPADRD